jgi:hypothetical protein
MPKNIAQELNNRIKELREYEEDGRRRAYDRESLPSKTDDKPDDEKWALGASWNLFAARFYVEELGESKPDLYKYIEFSQNLESVIHGDLASIARHCIDNNIKRKDCYIQYNPFYNVDRLSKEVFGKRCSWLAPETPGVDKYNLSSFLNDASACLHRAIDYLEDIAKVWHSEGKCTWRVK